MVSIQLLLGMALAGVALIGPATARPVAFSVEALIDDINGAVDRIKDALWPSRSSGSMSPAVYICHI